MHDQKPASAASTRTEYAVIGGISINAANELPRGTAGTSPYEYLPWDFPEFERDPYPWYARVLAEAPVLYDDHAANYVVSRYDDLMTFGKASSMSVEPGWDKAGPWSVASSTIIGRDLPDHTRLRRQTNRWFTPKVVRDWVATTSATVNEVLDSAASSNRIDGWLDLSVRPTHTTMCRILQVPDDGAVEVMENIADTMPMLAARPRPGSVEQAARGFTFLTDRVDRLIADKRAIPGDGLVDALVNAQSRGEISEEEMRATVVMLYSLGHMDVGYIIAAGLHIFTQLPEVFHSYRTNPEFRDMIVNEIVRYDPPELSFYRTCLTDVTIRGVDIPAGSSIRFLLAAANRDPNFFDSPHQFRFDRPMDHSRNLSFGLGPHSCAGQVISRAQARAVYDALATRYSRISLAAPIVMENTDFSRHFKTLELHLEP